MGSQPASFEAVFARAMKLLQSSNKDSAEQLKAMLDESLASKKAPQPPPPKQPPPPIKPVISSKPPPPVIPQVIVQSDVTESSGLSCVVCKRSEQKSGNEIVECQECHSLYHQECHKPSLANENVKDPRFVWYCSTCTSKRKKVKLPGKPPATLSGNNPASKETKDQTNPEVSSFKSWSFLSKK